MVGGQSLLYLFAKNTSEKALTTCSNTSKDPNKNVASVKIFYGCLDTGCSYCFLGVSNITAITGRYFYGELIYDQIERCIKR